jgi:alkyldihydroxyacetonephosphate synthase
MTARQRRIGGWGYEGETMEPSLAQMVWLETRLGPPGTPLRGDNIAAPRVPARRLGDLPAPVSLDARDRLAHARGQGLADMIVLRGGLTGALPDAVCRPTTPDEVQGVLRACASVGAHVIPWGGGTSVTGGVNVLRGDAPTVTLDLENLSGLSAFDELSGLATFGAGTRGPDVESALGARGLTLGHFPQSWELSTLGGWVATRSAGQQSLGYGGIEAMTAGVELVAPAGRLDLRAWPASAAGPDLRQLVLGSEGRLGVITRVTVRARPRPEAHLVEGALVPSFDVGAHLLRTLVRQGVPLDMLRLSDAAETQASLAADATPTILRHLLKRYLGLRGIGDEGCFLLFGASGSRRAARAAIWQTRRMAWREGGALLGAGPGRHWLRDRYRRPYLREALLDRGYATDTLETALPWSALAAARERVGSAIAGALADTGERVVVLCHVSHVYLDGASLYFTFFFRSAAAQETLRRWATIKRTANASLVSAGATLSHHHGVGQWHAPAYEAEVGLQGRALMAAMARHLDPQAVLNPHVLLDARDHMEE